MLYNGYSQSELDKIIAILDAHQVSYEVSADEQGIEKANHVIKDMNYHVHKRQGTVGNSFYSISIPEGALRSLSPSVLKELEKHNILPEMEMLPEEKKSPDHFIIDEKRGSQEAIGMGLSSLFVMIVAVVIWYLFVNKS